VALVIAPWNFPLAISVGMVSAALVTGNAVLYKPSSLSPVNGSLASFLLREGGAPDDALNSIPGKGDDVGDLLVGHPEVDSILFTGSRAVGLRIVEKAGQTGPGQKSVKRVVVEIGGKNAILIDVDADLDWGFRMSGVDSKSGGPDYLLKFMESRVITENTMRRGFPPDVLA